MKVSITTTGSTVIANALLYAFPKVPKVAEDYTLTIAPVEGETFAATLARTGGGKFPTYIYFMYDDRSYYLPKNVTPDTGTVITLIAEEAKPVALTAKVSVSAEEAGNIAEDVAAERRIIAERAAVAGLLAVIRVQSIIKVGIGLADRHVAHHVLVQQAHA